MRLLAVHADHLSFEPGTDDAGDEVRSGDGAVETAGRFDACVAAFVAVERADRAAPDSVGADAATELGRVADALGVERLAIVPCKHLVDEPSGTPVAAAAIRALAERLDGEYDLLRPPVGQRVAVDVAAKGHPFAVQSIRVRPGRAARGREDAGGTVTRKDPEGTAALEDAEGARIVTPEGTTLDSSDAESEDLLPGTSAAERDRSAATDLLAERGLAAEDPSAGHGSRRWLPRGRWLRDAVGAHAASLRDEAGAARVATPSVDVHAADDRRDAEGSDGDPIVGPPDARERLLHPGVHGGLLSLLADTDPEHLPVRVAETARWSDAGAGTGDGRERVRPEVHAALTDETAATEEFERLATIVSEGVAALGIDATPVLRATGSFRDDHPDAARRLAAALDAPVVERVESADSYWSARVEFVAEAPDGRTIPTGSVEIDAATPARFGLDGSPVLVHAAPVGSLEVAVEALLAAAERRDGRGLPTALAPTQVRLVPVDAAHADYCDDVAADLRAAGVRADVDARERPVGERIARAEREAVPYYAVVGERELDGEALPVAVGETGREQRLDVDALRERVLAETEGAPSPETRLPARVGDVSGLGGDPTGLGGR